ncbi:MAG: hypothetical protein HS108_03765 [Planctomycetes bacterium]|nr:hypothetical protein [Planctomycetota bacterium]MCL4730055.1 hypothetical protein [Planctomycetota bacterium]
MKLAVRVGIAALLVIAGGIGAWWVVRQTVLDIYEVERTEVTPATVSDLLADDDPAAKKPVFDPALPDSRPFGPEGNRWQINHSAALIALDVPDLVPGQDDPLLRLYPDYAAAAAALADLGLRLLPSVNLVGGKAKQFDDGLYAALELHLASNREQGLRSIELLLRQIMTECDPRAGAYAWLWAALRAGGYLSREELAREPAGAAAFLAEFARRNHESAVVGFYDWSAELQACFRFLRFLQHEFTSRRGLPDALLRAMQKNPSCLEMYQRMLDWYARLTNPHQGLHLLDLADTEDDVRELAAQKDTVARLHFLPYSNSRETNLFNKLYPQGLPREGTDLMLDFIKAIRDGKLALKPDANSGWYDWQLHALEAFVLPERGAESGKLVLSKKYKLRLVEAFKAMVTKHRETHVRQIALGGEAKSAVPMPPEDRLAPRLRVEPNPTYYLRYARGYAFLQKFLMAEVEDLNRMRGARQGGWRRLPLGDELEEMRLLFYGLHLVSCEDIGLKHQLLPGELENHDYARALAARWLRDWPKDPDLAADTRVAVPVYYDFGRSTKFWGTIGVRAVPLAARWATPPSWRPMPADGNPPADWAVMEPRNLTDARFVILVDEFAEFERKGSTALSRAAFRKLCDRGATKPEILSALNE